VSAADLSVLQRPNDRLRRRRLVSRGMELLAWLAAAVAVAILGIVVWSVAKRGASELNLDFLTKGPVPFAGPGVKQGLGNAFAGTLVMVGLATLMALPVGILIAIYVNEFAPRVVRRGLGLTLDILNGVPAIVVGIFVFGLLVVSHGQSGFAGGVALAVLMLPLVARSTIEVLLLVPGSLREASLGLGVARWRTTLGIVLPQAIGGIVTGAVLAVARVAGETAPLLFVSAVGVSQGGIGQGADWNPAHALQSVPVAIFELSETGEASDTARAWAAAFVLLMFILVTSLTARWLANRSRRKLQRVA
jgi:phosphate transport system permease protein